MSSPQSGRGGLLQYDFGKEIQDHGFHQTGFLNQPPLILRTAVAGLQAQYEEEGHRLKESIQNVLERNKRLRRKYAQPPAGSDRLYNSQYTHPTDGQWNCDEVCDNSNLILRCQRAEDEDDPAIHYGLVGSGNRLIKDAVFRDGLAVEQDVLCFEMEAAGLINVGEPQKVINNESVVRAHVRLDHCIGHDRYGLQQNQTVGLWDNAS